MRFIRLYVSVVHVNVNTKIIIFIYLLFSAVSYGKYCGGVMMDDPTACTHTCPVGEMKTCEHGGICTCGQYQLAGISPIIAQSPITWTYANSADPDQTPLCAILLPNEYGILQFYVRNKC